MLRRWSAAAHHHEREAEQEAPRLATRLAPGVEAMPDEEAPAPRALAPRARSLGGGQTLPVHVRAAGGEALHTDLEGVRVHTDRCADLLSRSLGARAFTTGRDIFFRRGAYAPGTSAGRELLAHELTHVAQQAHGAAETGAVQCALTQAQVDKDLTLVELQLFGRWIAARSPGPLDDQGMSQTAAQATERVLAEIPDLDALRAILRRYETHITDEKKPQEDAAALGADVDAILRGSSVVGKHIAKGSQKKQKVDGHISVLDEAKFGDAYLQARAPKPVQEMSPAELWATKVKVSGRVDAIDGFTTPDKQIFLRHGGATRHVAIHEGLHFYSDPQLGEKFGHNFEEGVTEMLARAVCGEQKIDVDRSYYQAQLQFIENMMQGSGATLDDVAKAYFKVSYWFTNPLDELVGKVRPWIQEQRRAQQP